MDLYVLKLEEMYVLREIWGPKELFQGADAGAGVSFGRRQEVSE
jgi:hypothetical protein